MGFLDGMASKLKTSMVEGALGAMGLEDIVNYIEKAPNDPEKLIILLVAYGIDLETEKHEGDGKSVYNPIVKFAGGEKTVKKVQTVINSKDPSEFPIIVRAVLRHLKLIVSLATIKQSTYQDQEFKDLGNSKLNPEGADQDQSGDLGDRGDLGEPTNEYTSKAALSDETDNHAILKEKILDGLVKFLKFLEKNMSALEVFDKELKTYLESPFGNNDDTFKALTKDGSLNLITDFMSTVVLYPGLLANDDFVPENISKEFHSIRNLKEFMNIRLELATSILTTIDNSIQGDDYENIERTKLIKTLKSGAQKEKPDVSNQNKNTLEKCDSETSPESKQICKNLTAIYKQKMNELGKYLTKVLSLEEGVRKEIEDKHFQEELAQVKTMAAQGAAVMGSGMPVQSGMLGMMPQPGMGMMSQPGMGMMSQTGMEGMPQTGMEGMPYQRTYGIQPGIVSSRAQMFQQPQMGIQSRLGPYGVTRGGGKSQTMLPGWMYGFFYPAHHEEKHNELQMKKKTLKKKRINRKKRSTLKHKKHKSPKKESEPEIEK